MRYAHVVGFYRCFQFFVTITINGFAKTHHTRGLCAEALAKEQSGYPGFREAVEIPGFPFSRE